MSISPSQSAIPRRGFLCGGAAAIGGAALTSAAEESAGRIASHRFRFALNTGTIRGQRLSLAEAIDVTADAGYDGIEPWTDEIKRHAESGGSLDDVRTRCADRGLAVVSAIGFSHWLVDDPAARAKGLEGAKRDMELVRAIGGTHIAAPPAGATRDHGKIDLSTVAERYAHLLEIGAQIGVTPQIETWGFSENLSRVGEAAGAAIETGRRDACILPDVFHMYKGGSSFAGLKLLVPAAIHCLHLNDYPAHPPRAEIGDEHRVYPGDGVAPLDEILGTLAAGGAHCWLSLELFNREYWKHSAERVAKSGLAAMKRAVAQATAA